MRRTVFILSAGLAAFSLAGCSAIQDAASSAASSAASAAASAAQGAVEDTIGKASKATAEVTYQGLVTLLQTQSMFDQKAPGKTSWKQIQNSPYGEDLPPEVTNASITAKGEVLITVNGISCSGISITEPGVTEGKASCS